MIPGQEKADQMAALSAVLFNAIERSGAHDDIVVIMGALGVLAGTMAKASGKPVEAMNCLKVVAEGVISEELLD